MQINVKGVLTDKFEIHRGVKQGCPLSVVLYVVAFNKKILKQVLFCLAPEPEVESGLFPWSTLTVIVKDQNDLNQVIKRLKIYEEGSGPKLNQDKREGVWDWQFGLLSDGCYVTTKMCPFDSCQEGEALEHPLFGCQRSREVRGRMTDGFKHQHQPKICEVRDFPREAVITSTGAVLANYLHCCCESNVCSGGDDTTVHPKWDCFKTNKNWPENAENIKHEQGKKAHLKKCKPSLFARPLQHPVAIVTASPPSWNNNRLLGNNGDQIHSQHAAGRCWCI